MEIYKGDIILHGGQYGTVGIWVLCSSGKSGNKITCGKKLSKSMFLR